MIEAVLNRLRGTGDVFNIGSFRVTGIMLYVIYLIGVLSVITDWYYALAFGVLFVVGESYAWGKWIGYLVDYEDKHTPEYDSKVGKGFPYIHYMVESVVSEKVNYERYCQVALAIRGLIWWMPVYAVLGFAGVVGWLGVVVASTVLAIGFPVACKIGREWKYNTRFGVLEFKRGWENQEVVYGLIQGAVFWAVLVA